MKALILSDIHANYPALQAVLNYEPKYDLLIFLGDVVDYGPHPKECLTFVKENADYYVRGNHDNALGYNVDCNCMGSFRQYSVETRNWHSTLLSKDDIEFLKSMPVLETAHIDDKTFFLAHASPKGNIFKYLNEDEIESEVNNIIAEYILVGHTHIQYKKKIEYNLVVNPGSVGLARDGGQACYAIYEDGNIYLKRINYDVGQTIKDLFKSPLSLSTKEGLKKILLHKP
ncbi:metallophosphoesterase [Melioribacteraceae bacterium 4301-Me]|uniref:metallophosphoesterase family protein n=1 Tax=Pyranulibacter aquaticus TaxID=3163344 RepID=UPI0035962B9C